MVEITRDEAVAAARRIQEAHERVERATAVAFPQGQCSFDPEWRSATETLRSPGYRKDADLLAAFVLAGDTERPEDDEALVERVACALYERAMAERRTFSSEPQKFAKRWNDQPEKGDSWRRTWREEAHAVLTEKG